MSSSTASPPPTSTSLILLAFNIRMNHKHLPVVIKAVPLTHRRSFHRHNPFHAPFRSDGASTLFKDVFFAVIRKALSTITIPQTRYIYKTTSETYLELCKEVKEEPRTLTLKADDSPNRTTITAHWIGSEDADVVILFLHGGGYTQPCTIGHMQYFHHLVQDINNQANNTTTISVLVLAYTLAPEAAFPTQLQQAASTLSHLLSRRSPSRIMITGDSAGGNLALSLLSHILHPHPGVPAFPSLSTPLRGVWLYSPWVSFNTTHESFRRNAEKDMLVPDMLRRWSAMYLGLATTADDQEKDPGVVTGGTKYNEPLLTDSTWWRGIHAVVDRMLIWAGEDEIFVDGLREFGDTFCQGWKSGGGKEEHVELEFARKEAHIGPILDVMLQYKAKSASQVMIERWLQERLE